MTSLSHRGAELTAGIVTQLTNASLVVGEGEAPAAGGWAGSPGQSDYTGYVVIYPTPGGPSDGTVSVPNADSATDYQIVSVGATSRQAETVADEVREVLTAALPSLVERRVTHVNVAMLGGAVLDDTVLPTVWMVSDRYRYYTTPA